MNPAIREHALKHIERLVSQGCSDSTVAESLLQYFVKELGPLVFEQSSDISNVNSETSFEDGSIDAKSNLQPLRIVHGWAINWNTLTELEPTAENVEAFLFSSSSLFTAVHHEKRFMVDIAWQPADDPHGRYVLEVYHVDQVIVRKAPDGTTKAINYYRDGHLVHSFETRSRAQLVSHLEDEVLSKVALGVFATGAQS